MRPCFPGVQCFNAPKSKDGFYCGNCPFGSHGDGIHCSDVDEVCSANFLRMICSKEFNACEMNSRGNFFFLLSCMVELFFTIVSLGE